MSIVDRVLGRESEVADSSPALVVTPGAQERIRAVLQAQSPAGSVIRVTSPFRGKYAMNLEPVTEPADDDTVVECDGFRVFVGGDSIALVRGATVDWVETAQGAGFQFTNPNDTTTQRSVEAKEPPVGPDGDLWREIVAVVEAEVNPQVAMHGGRIEILEVKQSDVFIRMSGGCQGCASASLTLRSGVERLLRDRFPSLGEIFDTTDHAQGRNPYYSR